jgi:hypothetical protein
MNMHDEILEKFCEIILGEKLPFSIVDKNGATIIKKGEKITANKVRKLVESIGNIYQSKEAPVDKNCLKSKNAWEKIKLAEKKFWANSNL